MSALRRFLRAPGFVWHADLHCWGLGVAFLWGPKGEKHGLFSHWWQIFARLGPFWLTVNGLVLKPQAPGAA